MDNFTPLKTKKKKKANKLFFITTFLLLIVVFVGAYYLTVYKPTTSKPKAECPCNPCNSNPGDLGPDPYCGCTNSVGQGYYNSGRSQCVAPTVGSDPCAISYTAKCITLSGNCSGRTIRTFSGPYSGGCPNQGGTDQAAAGGNTYCANAGYGYCEQVDLLDGGGVCDCKPGSTPSNTPTPTRTPTPPPGATNTPTPSRTPTPPPSATNTPTPSRTPTPSPSPTPTPTTPPNQPTSTPAPTATNTPGPTLTPVPVICGTKSCDNATNPCRSGYNCVQANDGSNYCTSPDFTDACKANPSYNSCCTAPGSPTITPTEIILAKVTTSPTTATTLLQTGVVTSFMYLIPAIIMLVGLML